MTFSKALSAVLLVCAIAFLATSCNVVTLAILIATSVRPAKSLAFLASARAA